MVFLVNKRMGTVAARTLATRVYPFSVDIQKNSNTSRIRKKIRLESIRFHSTHKGLSLVVLAAVVRSNKWGLSLDTLSNSPMELSLSEFIVYGSVSLYIHQSRNSNGNLST